MARTESPISGEERFKQVFSEDDARRVAQEHIRELKERHRRAAESRVLSWRRMRRLGRFGVRELERLTMAIEWIWSVVVTPHHRLGRLLRRLWLMLRSFVNLPLFLALVLFTLITLSRYGPLPFFGGSVGDAIGNALFGATLLGAIAAAWNDIFRCPYMARSIRRRIAKHPWCVLPTTTSNRWAELAARDEKMPVVPREDLYDEVLPGILDRRRSDIQMVVGEPGAGKTTALVGLAERLARMGIVPVVVPIWGEMPEDLIEAAQKRFKRNAESLIGSSEQLDAVWLWLRNQRRVVVAIDDVDRIAPDADRGFMLRRALDELAGANLPAVVTTRPSGIPAGLAASAIDLGELDPDAAVDHVMRVAGAESGVLLEDQTSTDVRERAAQWVRAGRFTEVPFYLELLARLVAAARCEELPPPRAVRSELGDESKTRMRQDGHCEWNPLWVRFRLLDQFYREIETGRVHRWLAIEDRERRSCLKALEEVALATLGATAMHVRRSAEEEEEGRGGEGHGDDMEGGGKGKEGPELPEPHRRRGRQPNVRLEIEEFLESNDRASMDAGGRQIVSAHEIVDTGERLRVLDRDSSGNLHFHHRIMQAYLAGRCLVAMQTEQGMETEKDWMEAKPPDWIGALLDPCHPERLTAQMTLAFAALHVCDRVPPASRDRGEWPPPLVCNILDRFVKGARRSLRDKEVTGEDSNDAERKDRRLDPRRPFFPERGRADPDDALAKLTTAAEIARATHATKYESTIVEWVRKASGTTMWTKLQAIPSIAALSDDARWECMWDFARDPDQEVRWAASEALSEDAFAAYKALEKPIRALLDRAALRSLRGRPLIPPSASSLRGEVVGGDGESLTEYDESRWDVEKQTPKWNGPDDIPSLRALGWILPAMVNGLQEYAGPSAPNDPATARIDEQRRDGDRPDGDASSESERKHRKLLRGARAALEQLVVLAFQGGNSELEASMAQGFKSDAMRHASAPHPGSGPGLVAYNRRFVTDFCIDDAEYWYARLVLHQALALYTIAGSNRRVAFDLYARRLRRGREPHPFVRKGARLARRAVMRDAIRSARWRSLLWVDEGVAVSRRPTELSAATAQLVADVTLLLNLRESAPEDSQADFPHMAELPHCLRSSRDRQEVLGAGCPRSCGYGLCPLWQPPPDEPNGQRTVSRAFCRGLYEIARRRKPPWQKSIRRRVLQRFWWEMERRART